MKSLKLQSMLLVSHRDQRAKKIQFHPQATVIKGLNDTGKSSLIKSIFYAFGAEPHNVHHRWKDADVHVLITFNLDGDIYSIYRHRKSFSLFGANGYHIGSYRSVTNELAPVLGKLFNFKLKLVDRDNHSITPPPAFLFLPFYIDQDKGWVSTWNSFQSLGQFPRWKPRVISYHFGVKPDQWYELDAHKKSIISSMDEPQRQHNALKDLKDKTREQVARVDFDIDVASFKNEIDSLIKECNVLKKEENKYRYSMSELKTEKIRVEAQIEIVLHTHDELSKDYKFATHNLDNYVGCPTCGAKYDNSFAERFSIAQDTETCVDLLSSLRSDLLKIEQEVEITNSTLNETIIEQSRINSILAKKQGKIKLKDLIQLEGKRELFNHLNAELLNQEKILSRLSDEVVDIDKKMKEFDDPEHRKKIINNYGEIFSRNAFKLDVTSLNEAVFSKIDCSIDESGSDLPRAILAYFYSSLELIKQNGNATFFPIVVDAPNQQEQDRVNLLKMLKFIKDNSSNEHQLILGLVDDCDIDFDGEVIELKTKNYLLEEKDYPELSEEMKYFQSANLGLV